MEGQDWAAYQAEHQSTKGIDFVIIKATEGTSYINPKQAAQAATVRADGLALGFYHFNRDGSPQKQAQYFVDHAQAASGDSYWCDWEDPRVSDDEKNAFIHEVKRLRPAHKTGLYCNLDFWIRRDHTSYCGDGLWIADPSAPAGHPRITHPWIFHQYSSRGGVDRDYTNKFTTRADLKAWQGAYDVSPRPPVLHPAPPAPPKPVIPPFPGRSYFVLGKSNRYVTQLGQGLVRKGFTRHNDGRHGYNPGPHMTEYDRLNLRDFQMSKKDLRGDADGYPGPLTWTHLFS